MIHDICKEKKLSFLEDPTWQKIVKNALINCKIKQRVEILQTFEIGDDNAFVNCYDRPMNWRFWILAIRFRDDQTFNSRIGTVYHECGHLYYKDPLNKNNLTSIELEERADKFGYEHLIAHGMPNIALERILEFLVGHHDGMPLPSRSPSSYRRAHIGFEQMASQGIDIQNLVNNPPPDMDDGLKRCLPLVEKYFPQYFVHN